ncbi:hypothetical protein SBOR_9073 [Sclerotinia borealis F-4128]|uniref:Uncharacterized protein n=1 Tax=Sclerotinia borealis (strain F-4128) TaxID=1432307 RepID=W9C167_SCLBF|nr:hypothetical protein SBOR_9073 [Sclerotinia borealis F-4128]
MSSLLGSTPHDRLDAPRTGESLCIPILKERQQRIKHSSIPSFEDSVGVENLDARFRQVPQFTGLKHFSCFSQVVQWTGGEEKDIIRILLPVVTPLLEKVAPAALVYTKAVVDFATQIFARLFDTDTLQYLAHALDRIDKTKYAFRKYRPKDKNHLPHWNYPKFHVLVHYVDCIQQFGALEGLNTEMVEAAHKYLIAKHNTRLTNFQAMEDVILHAQCTTINLNPESEKCQTARMTIAPLLLEELQIPSLLPSTFNMQGHTTYLHTRNTTTVAIAEAELKLPDFAAAIATYICQMRNKGSFDDSRMAGTTQYNFEQFDDRDRDISWVKDFPIQFHGALTCWKRSGKDYLDPDIKIEEMLRCVPSWRGVGHRHDFCWVQEYEYPPRRQSSSDESLSEYNKRLNDPLKGQRVAKLLIIMKIYDISEECLVYTGALVDVLVPVGDGTPNPVNGMREFTTYNN